MAAGRGFMDAPASHTTAVEPCHGCSHAALIQINQPLRRDGADLVEELGTPVAVGFRVPLDGMERLFLSRRPSCPTHSRTVDQLIFTPLSSASRSRSSATVTSVCVSTRATIRADTSAVRRLLGPGR